MRIRRGGIVFLDLVAAERPGLQLMFAGLGLPGQRPLPPQRRGDWWRQPGRLPGAAVDRHFDPAHSASGGPGDAGGDGRSGDDGRAVGRHVDPRSRFDGAGNPGPAARVPVIAGVRPRGQLDRCQPLGAGVGAPDPRRQQPRGEAVPHRQRLTVHAQRDQRDRPLPDHLKGESRREARNRVCQHLVAFGAHTRGAQQGAERDAQPAGAASAIAADRVVDADQRRVDLGQLHRQQLLEGELKLVLDQPADTQPPAAGIDTRYRQSGVGDVERPVGREQRCDAGDRELRGRRHRRSRACRRRQGHLFAPAIRDGTLAAAQCPGGAQRHTASGQQDAFPGLTGLPCRKSEGACPGCTGS
jgi:hypothetical protein